MTAQAEPQSTRVVSHRPAGIRRLRDVWQYRELLGGLIRKELKVKYKNSSLGFFWSMLNPALYLVVFYVVFQLILKAGIPSFAIFLLCGLLVWNLFSTGVSAACGSVVGNGALVKKVSFPREILALASVGASLVHFFLQAIVLLGALLLFRYVPSPTYMLLIPVALVVLLLFAAGLGILLSAINVYARDTEHLLELLLLAWFWLTPIVYPYRQVADQLGGKAFLYRLLNPITPIVMTFQRAIYNKLEPLGNDGNPVKILPPGKGIDWYLLQLGVIGVGAVVLLAIALRIFGRVEGNFAEEL